MRQVIGKFSLWLALSLMMAHNFTPHLHHSVREVECHSVDCDEGGILDFFKDLFHADLGNNHLDSFRTSEANPVPGIIAILPPISWEVPTDLSQKDRKEVVVRTSSTRQALFKQKPNRGPPSIV
ncbi:MAG: hypothetical protein LPK46_04485 [Bacteroidota bacterium]|nr:hypothetical protein [Bacteroidota bacterium]MDX5427433.1 hypothetical protein [Bacteroidota bacterium]MDX5447019.1 hypothetical protein [Bacteroidota bacterium]MDX5505378.1 hypothetical protein [Bacteroidota bacterium]